MSEQNKSNDAEEILSEFQKNQEDKDVEQPEATQSSEQPEATQSSEQPEATQSSEQPEATQSDITQERNVIFVGTKPIMTYVTATLTQLANQSTVTIKARGKRITQAVDVSQMIVKRMNTVGYKVNDVRIASDALTSQDGKQRNVSTIEIDIIKT